MCEAGFESATRALEGAALPMSYLLVGTFLVTISEPDPGFEPGKRVGAPWCPFRGRGGAPGCSP